VFHVANATIADLTAGNNLGNIFVAGILSDAAGGGTGNGGAVDVAVPELGTAASLALGLVGLAVAGRRRVIRPRRRDPMLDEELRIRSGRRTLRNDFCSRNASEGESMHRVRVIWLVLVAVLVAFSGTAQGGTLDTDFAGLALASIDAPNLVEDSSLVTSFGTMPTRTADLGLADARAGVTLLLLSKDTPDDVGVRSASNLEIALATPVYVFGSDPIDVEDTTRQNGAMVVHDDGTSEPSSHLEPLRRLPD
jgi:hypothetical protein